ncbi:MAG TPA: exonuclease subunit SbcD [Aquifex aeolicus]|uniref:Nuclease SbcCD subunit D n=1 Tax=Aquifex aeolicus TaxID=63363 RepID=A0A9D0YQ88_AQUAO|nr:exonuclease subunit SbcD [Aquificales bacterium]HIP86493.1 exonuclease subunit SbcD [Aquifex sp.]HIP98907.1 exonuclease subunit SbcD [Aquifex aeolicus]HIQ26509.1 exonuclease subunit SbcD [Aquifex aeolicus]
MRTIRLVHIADLHAGKTNERRLNRNKDLLHSLNQVLDLIKSEKADYLLVAGDIFDKKLPDAESLGLITEFFVKVGELKTKIVAVSGNHDSVQFLEAQTPWMEKFDIKLFTRPTANKLVFADGELAFVGIPFISERAITDLGEGVQRAKIQYSEAVKKLLLYVEKKVENFKWKILIGHLFFAGSKIGNSEIEVTVSDAYAVSQSVLPPTFDYIALGHVHRYQRLQESPTTAYYTGSLYQLDFGESGQDKFFNFVILEGKNPKVEKIKLSLLTRFEKLTLRKGDRVGNLVRFKKENTYYWVTVEADTPQEFMLRKRKLEEIFGENLLRVYPQDRLKRKKEKNSSNRGTLNLRNPVEVLKAYYKSQGREWNTEAERVIKKLLEEKI